MHSGRLIALHCAEVTPLRPRAAPPILPRLYLRVLIGTLATLAFAGACARILRWSLL